MSARFAVLIVATIVGGLALDAGGGRLAQPLLSVWVWALFALLLARSAPQQRPALLWCVALAAVGEVVLALGWGLYDYRLHNLPLFVPPGHVLLFVLGSWLAPRVPARLPRLVGGLALLAALALAASRRDLLSLPLTLVFLASLRFGRRPPLYAVMFGLALAMELWGTWLGNWAWRSLVPGLGWPALNPPFAAGAVYCVLDWLVDLAARPGVRAAAAGQQA